MPKTRKTAKISPPSPTPRYTDLAQTLDRDDDDPASVSRDPSVHASTPASTIRGGIGARPKGETFDRELREDRPEDPDRKSRRRRGELVDSISAAFGLEGGYWPGASFDWCRNSYGHRATFSRGYNSHCILIDLFAADGPDTRHEVEWKRAQLERDVLQPRLLLCLHGIGTNAGLHRMNTALPGATYKELAYVRKRYLNVDVDLGRWNDGMRF